MQGQIAHLLPNLRKTELGCLPLVVGQMFVGCNIRCHEVSEFERIADVGGLGIGHDFTQRLDDRRRI